MIVIVRILCFLTLVTGSVQGANSAQQAAAHSAAPCSPGSASVRYISCNFGSSSLRSAATSASAKAPRLSSSARRTLTSGSTSTVELTIDTNAPLGGGTTAMKAAPRRGGFSLAGLFLPAGLLMGWIGWRFRKRNAALYTALMVVALCGAALVTGCGGFSQKTAVPGTYTIQVTGVGTASNVSHYQTITLTITK